MVQKRFQIFKNILISRNGYDFKNILVVNIYKKKSLLIIISFRS